MSSQVLVVIVVLVGIALWSWQRSGRRSVPIVSGRNHSFCDQAISAAFETFGIAVNSEGAGFGLQAREFGINAAKSAGIPGSAVVYAISTGILAKYVESNNIPQNQIPALQLHIAHTIADVLALDHEDVWTTGRAIAQSRGPLGFLVHKAHQDGFGVTTEAHDSDVLKDLILNAMHEAHQFD
jgi:hypothetical protein